MHKNKQQISSLLRQKSYLMVCKCEDKTLK